MKWLLILAVIMIPDTTVAQQRSFIDSLKADTQYHIEYPVSYEPHYVLIERARKQGMKKALRDDEKGLLVLHQYYRPPDPQRAKVTKRVVHKMYGMKFVALTGSVSTQLMGYRYQAILIMKERYGKDYWQKVEQEVGHLMKVGCE